MVLDKEMGGWGQIADSAREEIGNQPNKTQPAVFTVEQIALKTRLFLIGRYNQYGGE